MKSSLWLPWNHWCSGGGGSGHPLTLLHLPHSYSLVTTPPLTHQGCLWPARGTELLFLSIGFRGEWNIFSHVFVCLGHEGLKGFISLSLLRCLPYKLLWRQHASPHNSPISSSFSTSNTRWIWMFFKLKLVWIYQNTRLRRLPCRWLVHDSSIFSLYILSIIYPVPCLKKIYTNMEIRFVPSNSISTWTG